MADTKISALPANSAPAGTDLLATAQSGNSVATSLQQVQSFVASPTASICVPGMIVAASTSTLTLSSSTASQKLFNVSTNGAVAVSASTYLFKCSFTVTSMSATSGNAKFDILGAGSAALNSAAFWASGLDATTLSTAAAGGFSFNATTVAVGNIVTAATGTGMAVDIDGIFRVGTAGTIIPSIALTTATAAIVSVNAFFWAFPIGGNTATAVGTWT